ncbi:hypothetical protein [Streptomyces sp. NPDC049040]|uniref:hypothetical protein n=1 Tax=Streptomyces sp. NPDC049040 TaxID=3365593 RepID=UPI00371114DA
MPSAISQLVDDLVAQMRSGSGPGFMRALSDLAKAARAGGTETLDATIESLAPWLPSLGGDFAKTAVLAGACVEWGGSPLPLADGLPQRAAQAMMLNAAVPGFWERAAPGRPLPEPVGESTEELKAVLATLSWPPDPPDAMEQIALSWHDMEDWLKPMITLLADPAYRAAVPSQVRADLRGHAEEVADRSQLAAWVGQLAAVLDDERLIVLDPRTRRGYVLTMGGVGDNHQLHILLADRLVGDPAEGLVAGERPAPDWVEAATAGDPLLDPTRAAVRAFRLFDGHGAYVAPEGKPSDVRPLDGTRVLVLHPPNGRLSMGNGRVFKHMRPSLSLDGFLTRDEAAFWLGRVAPAVENDLMAR